MKLVVLLPVIAAMAGLRLLRVGMLVWIAAWWIACFVLLRYGFVTPIPSSVIQMFMGIITLALLAYVTSDSKRLQEVRDPIVRFVVEPRYRVALAGVVIALPALAAGNAYLNSMVEVKPPSFGRTIHPANPDRIVVDGDTINLLKVDNPLRHLEHEDPEAFARHVEAGRDTYYRNCHFCHGDEMTGEGMFAFALNPIPTNFQDPGTIAMLTESFLFWRIAKGGPGLPTEGAPGDSAMPAWEKFLTQEEIWEVILFLYEFTDQKPRAKEVHE